VAEFKEFERRFKSKPWLLVPLKIVSNVSRFKPALNLNRVLADLKFSLLVRWLVGGVGSLISWLGMGFGWLIDCL